MTFEKIRELLAAQLKINAADIKPESRLIEDLKADSANVMVMVLELENQFDIEVEDEAIVRMKTVGDVVKYIEEHL